MSYGVGQRVIVHCPEAGFCLSAEGDFTVVPSLKLPPGYIKGTVGAGDAFCAGVSIGLTYGKTLGESVQIGTLLAASVITSSENVCPRFQPAELGLDVVVED